MYPIEITTNILEPRPSTSSGLFPGGGGLIGSRRITWDVGGLSM
jgi:hypothetical protein